MAGIKSTSPKLGEFINYPPLSNYEGLIGKYLLPAKNTFIGVEIELEKVKFKHHTIPSSFKSTDDGSLKMNGVEFITVPIRVKYLETELNRLFAGFQSAEATVRCSTHVHMNVRDMSHESLSKLLIIYSIYERILYRLSGNRWDNNFCVPLRNSEERLADAFSQLGKQKLPNHWYKYFGLNLCPIWGGESGKPIGTIEFRQMKGSTNTEEILKWVGVICCLKTAARRFTIDRLNKILENANTTSEYYTLTETIFGAALAKEIYAFPTFVNDIEEGITFTKYASICRDDILNGMSQKKSPQSIEEIYGGNEPDDNDDWEGAIDDEEEED